MTTEARQYTIAELDDLGKTTRAAEILYVLRRWPLVPFFILALLVVCALFAPWLAPHDPVEDQLRAVIASPAWYPPCGEGQISNKIQSCNTNGVPLGRDQEVYNFFLGADQLGRDILSRIIYGARISLTFASIAIAVGTVVGTLLGLSAGYYGGLVDEIVMRFTDVFTALPYIIIAISIVIVLGQSFWVIILVLSLASWPGIVRLVRGQSLQIRSFDYIALARVAGASTPRIMLKHMLPAVANTIVVAMTLQVGGTILSESILSFLGAGVPPPTPSWGADISNGREYLGSAWWVAFFPGMAIFLTVLSFNFIGDWLRDRWDPRLRQL